MSNTTRQYFPPFIKHYFYEIFLALLILLFSGLAYFCRDEIRKRLFLRKVKEIYEPILDKYQDSVFKDDLSFEKPNLKAALTPNKIQSEQVPFGYIFVPIGDEETIVATLIANIPLSSSLKTLRIYFDESLRKSLFRFLAYRLANELEYFEIAARIRDLSLRVPNESRDFEIIEKIYQQNGVLQLLLNEARIRYKRTEKNYTISDVREFSGYARKLSEIDVDVIRIGRIDSNHLAAIESCKEFKRSMVLYARGQHIKKTNKICEELCGERDEKHNLSYQYYSEEELGYSNPEEGMWYFKDNEVEFMRVWLKPVRWIQATDSSWITIE